jgi:hypothetical protein
MKMCENQEQHKSMNQKASKKCKPVRIVTRIDLKSFMNALKFNIDHGKSMMMRKATPHQIAPGFFRGVSKHQTNHPRVTTTSDLEKWCEASVQHQGNHRLVGASRGPGGRTGM